MVSTLLDGLTGLTAGFRQQKDFLSESDRHPWLPSRVEGQECRPSTAARPTSCAAL